MLAQGGEFGFVLFTLAREAGVLPAEQAQLAVLVIGLSMAATPALLTAARHVLRRLENPDSDSAKALQQQGRTVSDYVLIAGYGRVGQMLALLLESLYVPYIALDLDPELVAGARRRGLPVFFGDASRSEVLKSAAVERARAVVITLDEPDSASRTVLMLRQLIPDTPILARARDLTQCNRLTGAGATSVVPELVEGSLQLGGVLLGMLGETPTEVIEVLDQFRRETYRRLGDEAPITAEAGQGRAR
jgi:CPA2 family monovalent cation:H+ antiporter-2